ncbi:type VI secretion protein [Bradyrhizobium sp. Rc2d]|uniref:type VI secretion protein n=1 Tax=Bradyrhizobium sp. Rc2d TaxID=1855321 RepID=UPI001FCD1602|nr:type VI secretion protein [Bradyrhizobium sp. Rc2d]
MAKTEQTKTEQRSNRDAKRPKNAVSYGARKRSSLRTIIAVLVLSTCAQSAIAKEPDCRAIESATGRLACYDAAYPLKLAKPAIVEDDSGRPPYKDPLAAEEARIAAKLKNICRGC